jgi:hypothetical protein
MQQCSTYTNPFTCSQSTASQLAILSLLLTQHIVTHVHTRTILFVQVLSDGETRQRYDQFGEAGLRGSGMGGGGGGAGGYEVDLGIYTIQYACTYFYASVLAYHYSIACVI